MKKSIIVGLTLISILFFMTSCGVPLQDYDKVSRELMAAQTQIQSLQGEVSAAQTQIQSLQGEVSAKETELSAKGSELTAAQTQIQSLQGDLAKVQPQIQSSQDDKEAAEEKCAQALAYAEYLDILMNKIWKEAGLTPRFAFEGDFEWMIELRNRASDMGDAELSNYLKELEKRNESAMNLLWGHCLDRIEKVLK